MAEDLVKAAGLGQRVKIGGTEYEFRPLTMWDLAALQKHIKDMRLVAVNKLEMDVQEKRILRRAISKDPVTGDEMDAEMATFEGCLFLLWRSLRKTVKGMTMEQVGEIFTIPQVSDAMDIVQAISGMGSDEGSENPPKAPPETP